MNLSNAFNALPHGRMLAKLQAYGATNSACKFISDYLSSRSQRVKIGHSKSDWSKIKRVVPQGSVLGPLRFNIFLNDLFYFLGGLCKLYNYADDNTFSSSHKDVTVVKQQINNCLRNCY